MIAQDIAEAAEVIFQHVHVFLEGNVVVMLKHPAERVEAGVKVSHGRFVHAFGWDFLYQQWHEHVMRSLDFVLSFHLCFPVQRKRSDVTTPIL